MKDKIIETDDKIRGEVKWILRIIKCHLIERITGMDLFEVEHDCNYIEDIQAECNSILELINGLYQDVITEHLYGNSIIEVYKTPMGDFNYIILERKEII